MTQPSRFSSSAIDLSEVKARAEAKAAAAHAPQSFGGVSPTVVVTRDNAEAELVERSMQVPVVVHVGSSRAPASVALDEDLAMLAKQSKLTWIYAYVDADSSPELARMLGVAQLPTVVAFAGGQPLTSFEGGQPLESLQQWTAAVVNACAGKLTGIASAEEGSEESAVDPVIGQAEANVAAGDYAAAVAALESALASEPSRADYRQARDRVKLVQRVHELEDASAAVDRASADDASIGDVLAAADVLVYHDRPAEGFTLLVDCLRRSFGADKDVVRARLVEILALFDPADPRVMAARADMASALF